MAKKNALIIGGYKIPGGYGGAAVLKACEIIRNEPGIKQGDLLERVTRWAGLNYSTATWINTPGPKSPSGLLWERRKEGRGYKCYPNAHTESTPDARIALKEVIVAEINKSRNFAGWPVPGDLVTWTYRYSSDSEPEVKTALLLGLSFTWRSGKHENEIFRSWDVIEDISFYDRGSFYLHAEVLLGNQRTMRFLNEITKVSA